MMVMMIVKIMVTMIVKIMVTMTVKMIVTMLAGCAAWCSRGHGTNQTNAI